MPHYSQDLKYQKINQNIIVEMKYNFFKKTKIQSYRHKLTKVYAM